MQRRVSFTVFDVLVAGTSHLDDEPAHPGECHVDAQVDPAGAVTVDRRVGQTTGRVGVEYPDGECDARRQTDLGHPQPMAGHVADPGLGQCACRGGEGQQAGQRGRGGEPADQWQLPVPESVKLPPATGRNDQS